ncbi:MAG: helix-turn-helix domain-containing protein [Clostridia bacterium]|nr:helix-turn-helix domain-containing protein [Clostridia bacterium]
MHANILEKLMPITEEEKAILQGRREVDPRIYSEKNDGIVTAAKLMEEGKLITVRPHTRFVHFPEHTHDFVEAVYMCTGKTHHRINGNEICLQKGEFLLLGQTAKQEILPAGEGDLAVNFIILPRFFEKTLEMLGAEDTPIKRFLLESLFFGKNSSYLHFQVSEVLPVQNLIENLLWILIGNVPNRRNLLQTTMGLLIMQLLNHTDTLAYPTKKEAARMQLLRYVEEHYRNGSLTEAARLLHYDFYWLSHEVKAGLGKTYTELVQEKRLSRAAYLLENSEMPVEEIAKAVGYENKSYFHRLFLGRYGLTPKKYRDQQTNRKDSIVFVK